MAAVGMGNGNQACNGKATEGRGGVAGQAAGEGQPYRKSRAVLPYQSCPYN